MEMLNAVEREYKDAILRYLSWRGIDGPKEPGKYRVVDGPGIKPIRSIAKEARNKSAGLLEEVNPNAGKQLENGSQRDDLGVGKGSRGELI